MSLLTRVLRILLVLTAMACLVSGVWGGLLRQTWNLPLPTEHANWITHHGALMVGGFLGTVIGVERAAARDALWAYLAPILTASGGIALMSGALGFEGPLLFSLGSLVLVAVLVEAVFRQPAVFTVTMALGAAAWSAGNLLWLASWTVPRLVLWWVAFPTLTIVAERLELTRMQPQRPGSRTLFVLSTGVFLVALVVSAFQPPVGIRLAGIGLVALSLWLLRHDIARRTVRQRGLPRFTAVCLLSGYGWLALAGVLAAIQAPIDHGLPYDSVVHALFLGFVFAMIFGHAPIIFPAVMGLPIPYRPRFYAHLALLHVATVVRVAGDLLERPRVAHWGGLIGAVAIAGFLVNTVSSALQGVLARRH